jgi:ribosomal peptide maturation radical SAM protein 1
MFSIALVNMPFAALNLPSIGLTQLRSVLNSKFKAHVAVEIHYLNQDFAQYFGVDFYKSITGSLEHHGSGFGDWVFRPAAFPDLPDNAEQYFRRYYPHHNDQTKALKSLVREKQQCMDQFLDSMIAKYGLDQANVVGFTSMFAQNVACFAMARKIKERNPEVITVIGGANCESPMGQEIIKFVNQLDFVFSGPGLISFPRFIQNCLDDESDKNRDIKGVFARPRSPKVRTLTVLNENEGHPQTLGEELGLDETVLLDYDSFLTTLATNFPRNEVEPILLFETSRGCWWGEKAHCTFCGLNGQTMSYRAMATEKALEQFESIFTYSSRATRFNSVDNILPKSYLSDVFPKLLVPLDASLFYEVKADLSESDMAVLSTARVKKIQPGIESLASSTLKLMKKGTTVFVNLRLLKNCLIYGIEPEWNLLIGFPGEGEDVYKAYVRDLRLLMHLPPPHGVFPVRFDRFSPYFMQAQHYELDLRPMDFYDLTYPFGKESLANLAYYFMDHNLTAEYFTTMAKWIGRIKEQHKPWWDRWQGNNQSIHPALFFKKKGTATVVYDSRSDEVIEHEISDHGLQLLQQIDVTPSRLATIASKLSSLSGFDPEKEMATLEKLGLVFQERDRFLSLVLPQESRTMTLSNF